MGKCQQFFGLHRIQNWMPILTENDSKTEPVIIMAEER